MSKTLIIDQQLVARLAGQLAEHLTAPLHELAHA
jgi:hypothetical protein